MRRIAFTCLLSVVALVAIVRTEAPDPLDSAEGLARALQHRYDTVRDFSADFAHTYTGGVLRKQVIERGTVAIKKPGKMRWTYTAPEPKLFVSDGRTMYAYLPQDKQVLVSTVPLDERAGTAALFLAGRGDLARDFTVSLAPNPAGVTDARSVKLVPKAPQPEYDFLVLSVDPALRITALTTADPQGGTSTIVFANLKENTGLPDNTFAFRIPRGVDVITNGSPSR